MSALKKIHSDFSWPYPVLMNTVYNDLVRRKPSAETGVEERFRALRVDVGSHTNDSGYVSRNTNNGSAGHHATFGRDEVLSEKTIHAMLKPLSFQGKGKQLLNHTFIRVTLDPYSPLF